MFVMAVENATIVTGGEVSEMRLAVIVEDWECVSIVKEEEAFKKHPISNGGLRIRRSITSFS